MRVSITGSVLIAALAATACQDTPTSPGALPTVTSVAADRSTGDTPNYNLEVILRPAGSGEGFGLVKFREPKNDGFDGRVILDVWVRDLAPNTDYILQRAADTNPNGICSGTSWVPLGNQGNGIATPIRTDDRGTGRGDFFRTLSGAATFDIQFRVILKDSNPVVVVLTSECYQFTVR